MAEAVCIQALMSFCKIKGDERVGGGRVKVLMCRYMNITYII